MILFDFNGVLAQCEKTDSDNESFSARVVAEEGDEAATVLRRDGG